MRRASSMSSRVWTNRRLVTRREASRATAKVKMPDILPAYDNGLSSPPRQTQAGQAVSLEVEDISAAVLQRN